MINSPEMYAEGKKVLKHCFRVWNAPEVMTLPEWADEYRKLSRKNAARDGKWRTSTVEVARGPMLATDEPGVEFITIMCCTQLMKTAFLENFIGRAIHTDPGPILVIYPGEKSAEAFSKERLAPMIAETPVLRNLISDPRGRKSENTIDVKHFPGGFVAMVSAGSPMDLAARPVRFVLSDEVDKYAPTKEGDPILLGEERTATYDELGISLKIRCCSPTIEETSRIFASYKSSDQRKPYVPCPHCRHWQFLEFFKHVHWPKTGAHHLTEQAAIWCESCNKPWTEKQRRDALQKVRWYQTATFMCCGEGQDARVNRSWDYVHERRTGYARCAKCGKRAIANTHAGFTASKLYSPQTTVVKLAAKWIDAEKDPESKQTFYNTQLALPFRLEITKAIKSETVAQRRENYASVPDGACVLTAGVDVQSGGEGAIGRLELETVAWSSAEESWSIDYKVFIGDPAKPDVWRELDNYLLKPVLREDGRQMRIMATCIDSGGHNTEEVYKFCLPRAGRNVWAVKGASDRMGQWSPVWPVNQMNKNKVRRGTAGQQRRPVKIIGVNAAKEAIRQRLLIVEPGPGYCHFPAGRPAGYFDQLTSEKLTIERKGGMMIRRWAIQAHQSNEALDVRVYAYAALQGLINERGFKPDRVTAILQELSASEAEEGAEVFRGNAPAVILPPPKPAANLSGPVMQRQRAIRSNFMMRGRRY